MRPALLLPLIALCTLVTSTEAEAAKRRGRPTKELEISPAVPPPAPPPKEEPKPAPAAPVEEAPPPNPVVEFLLSGEVNGGGIDLSFGAGFGTVSPQAGGVGRSFVPVTPGLGLWISDKASFMRLDVSALVWTLPNLLDPAVDPLLVDLVFPRTAEDATERGTHNHLVRFRGGYALSSFDAIGLGAVVVLDYGFLGAAPAATLQAPTLGGDSFAVGLGPAVVWTPLRALAVYGSADVEFLARFTDPFYRGVGFAVDGDVVYNLVPRVLSLRASLGLSTRFFIAPAAAPAPGTGVGVDGSVGVILQWDWIGGPGGGPGGSRW